MRAGSRSTASVATLGVIVSILYLVLAKPAFRAAGVPAVVREPGGARVVPSGLQSLLETMRPMP